MLVLLWCAVIVQYLLYIVGRRCLHNRLACVTGRIGEGCHRMCGKYSIATSERDFRRWTESYDCGGLSRLLFLLACLIARGRSSVRAGGPQ